MISRHHTSTKQKAVSIDETQARVFEHLKNAGKTGRHSARMLSKELDKSQNVIEKVINNLFNEGKINLVEETKKTGRLKKIGRPIGYYYAI